MIKPYNLLGGDLKLILMRHYKVLLAKDKYMDSATYDKWCKDYNTAPIKNMKVPELPKYRLYASSMQRAKETAYLATGRQPEELEGVFELTFNSFMDTKKKLPFWLWELMARLQWLLNSTRQKETRNMTVKRLKAARAVILERNEDAIIVMHSFVMRIFSRLLIKSGFKGKKILMSKNGACYEYEKWGKA